MTPQPSGIEVVWVSAADVAVAVLVFVVLVGLAFAAGAWAMRGPSEPEPAEVDDLGSVTTVEIPADSRPRGRTRQPYTGTVHAAHLAADDSPTEVIRRPNGVVS